MAVAPRNRTDIHIRPYASEVRAWKAHARRDNKSLTDWIRERLNVTPVPPSVPAALPDGAAPPAVTEMRLCEARMVVLHPKQLYLFSVDPDCEKCVAAAGGTP